MDSKNTISKLSHIEDRHAYCKDQKEMFTGLKKLMQLKLSLYHGSSHSQAADAPGAGQSFQTNKGNVFVL